MILVRVTKGQSYSMRSDSAMQRWLLQIARVTGWAIALLVCASVATADDGSPFIAPEKVRAFYEMQMADADFVPKAVQDAFVAAEDRYFYSGRYVSSTITQELAKRFIPPGRGMQSYKLSELATTIAIEQALERTEILAWYLHGIYLGRGCYGVEAASQAYFGREPEALTLAEAAMLAALPKAPTLFDPSRDPVRARDRRDLVLAEMVKAGFVTEAEADTAAVTPVDAIVPPAKCAE